MSYTKAQLFNDINALVEKYLEQEITNFLDEKSAREEEAEILVESDSEHDDIDITTGDIWDLESQTIIGKKNLETKEKQWFNTKKKEKD